MDLSATSNISHTKDWFAILNVSKSKGKKVALGDDIVNMVKHQDNVLINVPNGRIKEVHGCIICSNTSKESVQHKLDR
jgi:hypothetical protein